MSTPDGCKRLRPCRAAACVYLCQRHITDGPAQGQDAGRGDGQLVHAQAQEGLRQTLVRGQLAADADTAALQMRIAHRFLDRAQHSGVMRVAERRERRILPVHGQQVLRQIVRANGEEVDLPRKLPAHKDGRGRLDHDAGLIAAEALAAGAEGILRVPERGFELRELRRAGPWGT